MWPVAITSHNISSFATYNLFSCSNILYSWYWTFMRHCQWYGREYTINSMGSVFHIRITFAELIFRPNIQYSDVSQLHNLDKYPLPTLNFSTIFPGNILQMYSNIWNSWKIWSVSKIVENNSISIENIDLFRILSVASIVEVFCSDTSRLWMFRKQISSSLCECVACLCVCVRVCGWVVVWEYSDSSVICSFVFVVDELRLSSTLIAWPKPIQKTFSWFYHTKKQHENNNNNNNSNNIENTCSFASK